MTTNRPTRLSIGRRMDSTESTSAPSQNEKTTPATSSSRVTTPNREANVVVSSSRTENNASFDELMKRYETLKNNRSKLEFQHEQAEKTVKECEQIAKRLGINSLEELENKIKDIQQKEADDLKIFEANLSREIETHNQIKASLENIDSEAELD